MATHSEELKALLLRTDAEYRQLAEQHSQLDDRLRELTTKTYLSDPEQLEASTLKKQKLALKDRMELIMRRSRAQHAPMLGVQSATGMH